MIELNAVAKEIVKCLERVGFPFIAPHCRFFVHFLNMNLQHFTLMKKLVKLQWIHSYCTDRFMKPKKNVK